YKVLEFQVVTTEGSDWRRHRRIATPTQRGAGNAFVWKENVRIINDWFTELDMRVRAVVGACAPFTGGPGPGARPLLFLRPMCQCSLLISQATLLIISSAGFGRCALWNQ
ncbi:hypothetical protein GGX14DRAFT_304422, partial [Mycena pura]